MASSCLQGVIAKFGEGFVELLLKKRMEMGPFSGDEPRMVCRPYMYACIVHVVVSISTHMCVLCACICPSGFLGQ